MSAVGRKLRSLDILALLGLAMSIGAVFAGNLLEGGSAAALLQLTAFVIVVGGTVGAVLLQTPLADFRMAIARLRYVFLPPGDSREAAAERLLSWSRRARRDGLLALESELESGASDFEAKGLRLVIDGFSADDIRSTLAVHVESRLSSEMRYAQVYEAMGGYAPTIGILGAVLGLIQVMRNLADPAALGQGIAVAFVATIYGVGFANLLFLPVANKLRAIAHERARYQDLLVAGIAMIAQGDNPRAIRSKLEGYLH